MTKSKAPPITIGMVLILFTALSLIFAYSCECPAQEAEVKPTKPPIVVKPTPSPIVKPTPATADEWSAKIEESSTVEKFVTKKMVVASGDVAQYPTEKIVQDSLSDTAVKGVRLVKTYKLWERKNKDGTTTIIPLSQGWKAVSTIDTPVSVDTKPTVEVFK